MKPLEALGLIVFVAVWTLHQTLGAQKMTAMALDVFSKLQ